MARRPRTVHERCTAKALFAETKAQGDTGGYTVVTDFSEEATTNAPMRADVPLKFELGGRRSVLGNGPPLAAMPDPLL